jgi:hypothetical protein
MSFAGISAQVMASSEREHHWTASDGRLNLVAVLDEAFAALASLSPVLGSNWQAA